MIAVVEEGVWGGEMKRGRLLKTNFVICSLDIHTELCCMIMEFMSMA